MRAYQLAAALLLVGLAAVDAEVLVTKGLLALGDLTTEDNGARFMAKLLCYCSQHSHACCHVRAARLWVCVHWRQTFITLQPMSTTGTCHISSM